MHLQRTIPDELRALPQWCVAGPNKEPIDPKTGRMARTNDPHSWGTFEEAYKIGERCGARIGFVLTENDPYCILDMDDKPNNPATEEERDTFARILDYCKETYCELSQGGRGYHVIVRGSVTTGRKAGRFEVYSTGRFMILTGNSNGKPIVPMQDFVNLLVGTMPAQNKRGSCELVEGDESYSDAVILEMALSARNGDKVRTLTQAPELWRDHYPSQSEADFALISCLYFWTQSPAQIARIFRCSPLGQREKAQRDDYIMAAIGRIVATQPPAIDCSALKPPEPEAVPVVTSWTTAPGFMGRLARQMMEWAPRPVEEIETAAALALVAGIVGRAYNVNGTGLNQYLILLGATGRGKEAIAKCTGIALDHIRTTVPTIDDFRGPGGFASSQGFIKAVSKKPCFFSIIGEFGLELRDWCNPRNTPKESLRKVVMDVYGKSGDGTLLSTSYSDAEKNTATVKAPAVTLIGETTQDTFYDVMGLGAIAEGFMPRWLTIHYDGIRVPANEQMHKDIADDILRQLVELSIASLSLMRYDETKRVDYSTEAHELIRPGGQFDKYADKKINSASNGALAELWNRAHLKALKLSALLAVADNPHNPVISKEHVEWTINLIVKDIEMMEEKFSTGDVGVGDAKQSADLRRAIKSFFTIKPEELLRAYAIPPELQAGNLIPYVYLQRRTSGLASFKSDRLGATAALKRGVEELVSTGELVELPRSQGHLTGYTGRLFTVGKSLQ